MFKSLDARQNLRLCKAHQKKHWQSDIPKVAEKNIGNLENLPTVTRHITVILPAWRPQNAKDVSSARLDESVSISVWKSCCYWCRRKCRLFTTIISTFSFQSPCDMSPQSSKSPGKGGALCMSADRLNLSRTSISTRIS